MKTMVLIYNIMPSVFNITESILFFNSYFSYSYQSKIRNWFEFKYSPLKHFVQIIMPYITFNCCRLLCSCVLHHYKLQLHLWHTIYPFIYGQKNKPICGRFIFSSTCTGLSFPVYVCLITFLITLCFSARKAAISNI